MSKSSIEWTDETWNPVTGCTKVSAGCKHCYAERLWARLSANPKHVAFGREFTDVQCHPERLEQPLRWKRQRMVFVNSMSDLFHEDVPEDFIHSVFCIMDRARHNGHKFQVLTKRPERMLKFITERYRPRWRGDRNYARDIWLGVSVEDQETADERIPLLLQTPAAVRFISAEPLLEKIDLMQYATSCRAGRDGDCIWDGCPQIRDGEPHKSGRHCPCDTADHDGYSEPSFIDWVIVGGESGPKARPMHPEWVRGLRNQCEESYVPFFFKQWGEWAPPDEIEKYGQAPIGWSEHFAEDGGKPVIDFGTEEMFRVGKKDAGCLLDGVEHKEWPEQMK